MVGHNNLSLRSLLFSLSFVCILVAPGNTWAQTVVWYEDFGTASACDKGNLANGASGNLNGPWTVTDIGTQSPSANTWYISATERGRVVNQCSEFGCPSVPNTDRNLHVGNILGSPTTIYCPDLDCGAVYDPGFGTLTDRRAESPVINLTGKSNLALVFKYIMKGDSAFGNDFASVEVNTGSGWVSLGNTPPSATGCVGSAGLPAVWTRYVLPLPASANNNPNVRIGFRWRNNEDATGLDQSFAVDSVVITALPPPTANFNADRTTICPGDCINFLADTSSLITSYSWSFIGNTPGSASVYNPQNICFANVGTYTVRLIVSGPSGADTLTLSNYITVNPCGPPTPDIVASDTDICERSCITFADQSLGATKWKWFFPGGNPSLDTTSGPNPSQICYQTPGLYNVILIVSNQYGSDTLVKTNYIKVNVCPIPVADYTSTITRLCPQHCISFLGDTALGVNQWHWYFPGATPDTSSLRNPTVCYTEEGLYDVELIVENQYGSDTLIRYSDVQVSFIDDASVSPDTTMNFGDEYQLVANGGLTYQWSPSLGLDSIYSQTPIASPAQTTTYVVLITDTNGCKVTRQVTVTVLHSNRFFVPNSFSPNGDGSNDYLYVRGNNLYGIRFTIFDRWGEMIFETTDPSIPWDGTFKGKQLDPGVFTWIVTVNFDDAKSTTATGSVTLVR